MDYKKIEAKWLSTFLKIAEVAKLSIPGKKFLRVPNEMFNDIDESLRSAGIGSAMFDSSLIKRNVVHLYLNTQIVFPSLSENISDLYIYPERDAEKIQFTREEAIKVWDGPFLDYGPYLSEDKMSRSLFLWRELLSPLCKPEEFGPILDIGCGPCRDLAFLQEMGCKDLTGIDISCQAIRLALERFPNLKATLIVGEAERLLDRFERDTFHTTYAIASLEHVHPDYEFMVFDTMQAITSTYIIAVADETTLGEVWYPRNFRRVFERGNHWKQIHEIDCDPAIFGRKYVARIFKKAYE